METTSSQYEYPYSSSNPTHHHAYLITPLLELLSQGTLPSKQKPRILDLGCGNGSLSYLIAQQGYEVVGVEESESGIKFKFAGRFPYFWKSMLCSSSPVQS